MTDFFTGSEKRCWLAFRSSARSPAISVVAEVLAQRSCWERRGAAEFYTLGAASYLDDGPTYHARATELNPLLLARFGPPYAHLLDRLPMALGAPAVLADGKAIPGFHIAMTIGSGILSNAPGT